MDALLLLHLSILRKKLVSFCLIVYYDYYAAVCDGQYRFYIAPHNSMSSQCALWTESVMAYSLQFLVAILPGPLVRYYHVVGLPMCKIRSR